MEIIINTLFSLFMAGLIAFGIIYRIKNPPETLHTEYGNNEKNICIVILAFLKLKGFDHEKCLKIILEAFNPYNEILFVTGNAGIIKNTVESHFNTEININPSCIQISQISTKHKLFLLYNLLDIAAADRIYSYEEEAFIEQVRSKIRIPLSTFNTVKAAYSKKGMKDERQIKAEEERKKVARSYLPYNAYKILGITSSVSKAELKKVYRTLAKKFHPDKFHGKSDEMIRKAEEKFQEITKAYKIIMKHKNYE